MKSRDINPALAGIAEDFAKDAAKETGGVWMTYKRFQYRVARAHRNNAKFLALMELRMRPYQWAIERNNFQALRNVAQDVMQEVYAETILLGIRPVPTADAAEPAELPYEAADGVALFGKLPDLWDNVFQFAGNESNYSPDQIKDDSKN